MKEYRKTTDRVSEKLLKWAEQYQDFIKIDINITPQGINIIEVRFIDQYNKIMKEKYNFNSNLITIKSFIEADITFNYFMYVFESSWKYKIITNKISVLDNDEDENTRLRKMNAFFHHWDNFIMYDNIGFKHHAVICR